MAIKTISSEELRGFVEAAEFEQIVQKNHERYKKKWLKLADKKKEINPNAYYSWNWAAFLLQEFWLLYRKMYMHFFCITACRILILLAALFPISDVIDKALNGATIGLTVIIALMGNSWYLSKCFALAENAKTKFIDNAANKVEFFNQYGGTSLKLALSYLLVFCLLIAGSIFFVQQQSTSTTSVGQVELRINSVRDGVLALDESITLANALESNPYIQNPRWELFEVEPNRYVVRFSGQCDVVKEVVEVQEREPQDLHEVVEGVDSVMIAIDFLISADNANFDAYQAHFFINGKAAFTGPSEFAYNLLKVIYSKQHFILKALMNIREY